MVMQDETPTNKYKGLQDGRFGRTEEELYKKALALLEKCKIEPGRSGQEISELEPAASYLLPSSLRMDTSRRWAAWCDAERVGGFGSRHFRASEKSTASKRMEHTLLSKDNEICLAWLADTLQQLRPEGRGKAVGYLEAVLEEVVFEMKMAPRS
jgi:hypothetical protein